ncbi:NrsF family protein [Paracraurococcus lichenis]|uniref:NrsF family protein n=1 Tax=Paracraurococcus lichenis TaxID=3064888 RepID=A0ABT9DUU1_9PROT|nr:NrsF family protein [Paracraurococcus sp. LOR1-02]MDO9707643.1 NrsF family protein [Paracraurococcus sp. LOR1-02]
MESEALIDRLAGELRPVRRMPPPGLQAMLWLALAVLVNAVAVAASGLRHDIAERMALAQDVSQFLASIATGVAAALAAAMLARPDRSPAWALLPLGPLLLWLGGLGWGCFADLARMGPGAWAMGTSWACLRYILLIGTPLAAAMLLLLRHAGPVRPLPVLLLGGLASAALCSAGLSLIHHLDAMLMVLVWHGGAVAVVVVLGWALGGRLLMRPPRA